MNGLAINKDKLRFKCVKTKQVLDPDDKKVTCNFFLAVATVSVERTGSFTSSPFDESLIFSTTSVPPSAGSDENKFK